MEDSKEEIISKIKEIREFLTEEKIKEIDGDMLVNYLMEVRRLESLLMTAIDDYSRDIK